MSLGTLASTSGFGCRAHSSEALKRFSKLRTEVNTDPSCLDRQAQGSLQFLGIGSDDVHDALPLLQAFDLFGFFLGRIVYEELVEELGRGVLRGNHTPGLGVGGAIVASHIEDH